MEIKWLGATSVVESLVLQSFLFEIESDSIRSGFEKPRLILLIDGELPKSGTPVTPGGRRLRWKN
jgi:hypothetical protein